MAKTVAGLFDGISDAYKAVFDLKEQGFSAKSISIISYDPEGAFEGYLATHPDAGHKNVEVERETEREGLTIGGILGGLGGFLIGLGVAAVPGIGTVLTAGSIAIGLLAGGTGAVLGSFVGAMVDAGISPDHAAVYTEGVRRGGTLVLVEAKGEQVAQAENLLRTHGAVDIEERAAGWRAEGWQGPGT